MQGRGSLMRALKPYLATAVFLITISGGLAAYFFSFEPASGWKTAGSAHAAAVTVLPVAHRDGAGAASWAETVETFRQLVRPAVADAQNARVLKQLEAWQRENPVR